MKEISADKSIPHWLVEDNQSRIGKYVRNVDDEIFLRELNDFLNDPEDISAQEINFPIIFFFGVPRCGKTFFSQLMNHYFDLGYPDNIIARFWRAPYYGISLSQLFKSTFNEDSDFSSDFGKTKNLFDPHDFAYFWHDHLNKSSHPYDFIGAKSTINFEKLNSKLALFVNTFKKPCLFKGVNPSYHITEFYENIPNIHFIYIERDLIDCAVSLARARVKNYNDINHWYGQTPSPQVYHELKQKKWSEQIAGQLKWLVDHYQKELKNIPSEFYSRVNYREFCQSPATCFESIKNKINTKSGFLLKENKSIIDEKLKFSTHPESTEFYAELAEAFFKIDLDLRLKI